MNVVDLRVRYLCICFVLLWTIGYSSAADRFVNSQEEYRRAVEDLNPGDSITLANGTWRDFEVLFVGEGEQDKPITLKAETNGKVILSGQSNLRLAGRHLLVSGLVFRDGYSPTNTVIAFRRTKGHPAFYSRVTETVIDHFSNPERHETDFWVLMFGQHNRFDHNHLVGKGNAGVTMAVRLDGQENQNNHHLIDHNYFGPRPVLGSNGGETLRVGTSHYSMTNSQTTIVNNVFDRCNGEVEIVSIKAGQNVVRGNLFIESRGTLTLRHGNGNLLENNVFLGNGVPNTGGIRVINKGHIIRNNYFEGLTGYRFGGGFVVMNGVPNSPINRYHQVEDVVIERNSIIDVEHIELAAGSDSERSATPIDTAFHNNLVSNRSSENVFRIYDDLSGISFENNVVNGLAETPFDQGFNHTKTSLQRGSNGLLYLPLQEHKSVGVSRDLAVIDIADTGVGWYPKPKTEMNESEDSIQSISISPAEDVLFDAANLAYRPVEVMLEPGEYIVRKTIVVNSPVTLNAQDGLGSVQITFERTALFEIVNGGVLELNELEISGTSAPDVIGNSVIRSSRYSMVQNYELAIRNSRVFDLNTNHSFNFLTVAKNTFAESIRIENTEFKDVTGSVIELNEEVDKLGRYNVEFITVNGSRFTDIGKTAIDIVRGGTDESTFGPRLFVIDNQFHSVGLSNQNETGTSIHLVGVQVAEIAENEFVNSKPIHVVETVGEPQTRIQQNRFVETPEPLVTSTLSP